MSCSICLLDFKEETEKIIKQKTVCSHEFCKDCLDKWLEINNTCPICRQVLKNENENKIVSNSINVEIFARTFNLMRYFDGIGGLTYSS